MTDPAEAPRFMTDPVAVIAAVVTDVEPGLDEETVLALIHEVAPSRARRRELARAISEDADLLTSGQPKGPRAVEALIRALQGVGATSVVLPRCAGCDKTNALVNLDGQGRRICATCYNKTRGTRATCSGCGRHRVVARRDRQGKPRCPRCPAEPDHDHTAEISLSIREAAGTVPPDFLQALVEQAIPHPSQRRRVAWELDGRPELLTGQAAQGSPRLIELVELLVRHDVPGIVAPVCPFCHRQVRLKFGRDGQRCCRRCYDVTRTTVCSTCGKAHVASTRTLEGQPQCISCMRADPINHERCAGCGRRRHLVHPQGSEEGFCSACWRGHRAVCSICRKTKPCHFAFTEAPRCENCSRNLLSPRPCARCHRHRTVWARTPDGGPLCGACARRRAPCCRCGGTKQVKATISDGPVCGTCFKTEPTYFRHCAQCGTLEHLHHFGLCQRCACPPLLRQALTGTDGETRAELEPVIQVLLTSDPGRLLTWLSERSTRTMLAKLAAAPGPITHDVLDQLGSVRKVKHLRDTLVAAKLLPDRDEILTALERWVDTKVASVPDPAERATLRSFVTWTYLRRLRRRSPVTIGQTAQTRFGVGEAVALLLWLRQQDKILATCTQADIDTWIAGGNPSRLSARPFLTWAVRQEAAHGVDIPGRAGSHPRPRHVFPEADYRWTLARRLLHDSDLDVVDRTVGLLVLLYGQHLSKISQLTIGHVVQAGTTIQLKLGAKPLELPSPLDDLITSLVRRRQGHAVLGHTENHPWLFPGGTPGRHLTAGHLVVRMGRLGIPTRIGRNTALMELATELPAPVISQLLGLHIETATTWATVAGNTHHGYAADLPRRRSR